MANTASIFVNHVNGNGISFAPDGTPNPQGSLSISGLRIILTPTSEDTDYSITFIAGTGMESLDSGTTDSPLVSFPPFPEAATTLQCTCHYPTPPPGSEFLVPFSLASHPEGQEGKLLIEDPTFVFKPPGEGA